MTCDPSQGVTSLTRRRLLQGTLSGAAGVLVWQQGWPYLRTALAQKGEPSGQMTWAIHVTIAPTWFDPAETPGIITPFMFLYALHDALMQPMPDGPMSPCGKVRPMERAGFVAAHKELTLKDLAFQGSGAFGHAATRLEAFAYSQGRFRGLKTRRSMRGMNSRRPSATARSVKPCYIKSSRSCMTKHALWLFGNSAFCVPQAHGWRCQGWA